MFFILRDRAPVALFYCTERGVMEDKQTDSSQYYPNVETRGEELVISYKWRMNGRAIPGGGMLFIALCILWVMSNFYWCLLKGGNECYESRQDLPVLVGVTFFMAIMFYLGIGFINNSTVIAVSKAGITFRILGLPWIGNTKIPASKIRGVYVSERRSYTRGGGRNYPYYTVRIEKGGIQNRIYGEFFNDEDQANQLAARVRLALGIKV